MNLNQVPREIRLASYDGEDKIVSSIEYAERLKAEPKPPVISTKMTKLDKILDGVEAGELIVVSGPTGNGKTSLLATITHNLGDFPACWFSFEVSPRQFFARFNFKPPLFYLPEKITARTLDWVEERIVEAIAKHKVKVVFIDHLHFLFNLTHIRNSSLEIGDMVAKIKDIAVQHELVIFLIVHPQKKSQDDKSEPHHDDIRDSGLIAQYADTCMNIWRVSDQYEIGGETHKNSKLQIGETDSKAIIRISKNRRTGTLGKVAVFLRGGFFEEAYDAEKPKERIVEQDDYLDPKKIKMDYGFPS